jgi:alpha-beta hydrolase superfamily lysophospholipase
MCYNNRFLILHGSADEVTDPEVYRALYEAAASKDKTIKITVTA